jgi:serine/threonine protein kinase/tetratricopeptide (TPR) repeat protein
MPDASGPSREKEIFERALDIDSVEERQRFLAQACGDDAALLNRVEALLKANEESSRFLPDEPLQVPMLPNTPVTEKAGDRIGHYKLLQEIGEGGCGIVYMAEQEEPVRRRVALKVLKLGMDTKSVIARFEAERQALALMDHPNIAKVLDAGATDTGRPYFVMELVRGVKITDFCDEAKLSTQARLNLFVQVCQAIQHAHQKGVIHRDIKPSNILVTVNDGVPVPKVIDFGIAKATVGRLTSKTLFTAFEQFIGTPAYMSPEQAVMTSVDIDTRSDIYSLGVLLYELLTGKTPFDTSELLKAGLDEMRRTIREEEPARPSTRISTLSGEELTTTAKRRGLEAPKLINQLRGDLDWIVMKCLEKDRVRRYETANGLGMDLQRHLNNEPVLAGPPNNLYRLKKLVLRNKMLFAATGAVSLALVVGLGLSTWLFFRERASRREQERLRQQAATEAAKSQQVAKFLTDMLEGVGPSKALGRDTTMLQEILNNAEKRVSTELTNQPAVQAELQITIGEAYVELGQYLTAEKTLREALKLSKKVWGNQHTNVARSLYHLGWSLLNLNRLPEAEDMTRERLDILRNLLGSEHASVASALNDLGSILSRQGKLAQAETLHRESLAMSKKLLGQDHRIVAAALGNLALDLEQQGKFTEAEGVQREVLESKRRLYGNEHPSVAQALNNLGMFVRAQGRLTEAEAVVREALRIRRKMLGNEHPDVVGSLNILADVLFDEGKFAEVDQLVRQGLIATDESDPKSVQLLSSRGLIRGRRGQFAEAATDLGLAIKLNPGDHQLWHGRAQLLVQTGQIEAYREHCAKSAERFSATPDPLTAERIAKDCLLLPSSGVDLKTIDKMTDTAINADARHWAMPCFQLAKALAEYRQDRFGSAAEWIRRTPFLSEDLAWTQGTIFDENSLYMFAIPAYAVLSMAEYRLNQVTESQAALAKAWAIAEVRMPSLNRDSGDIGDAWCDWITANILLQEAKAIVGGQSAPGIEWQAEVTRLYRRKVERLRKAATGGDPQALNEAAWLLATCPDAAVRDGPDAVAYAEKAVSATNRKNFGFLDTLAAAYAEVGRFSDAVRVQKEAIATVASDERSAKDLGSRLKLYEANTPCRQR